MWLPQLLPTIVETIRYGSSQQYNKQDLERKLCDGEHKSFDLDGSTARQKNVMVQLFIQVVVAVALLAASRCRRDCLGSY
ncbi:unnamed protein product [Peronospora belbahrii]|uniref:Uncharacterized protein n=1 Tax=Peronospora belbahrii TaxID=622444 RepID=A0ABN8D4M3_9STRA|nr:unnamed protein product [Peronospora belbahrii]